ncbi:sybindin-like family protein [Eremomyces bilateralis CBS 781.70]|uniref:Trafficking protein particle complex subunit n=1 Tax=Eremomyces bilateralis CBS 781.70 TaxID=1392243 RepID=A0A6G1FT60_9PEZI|nr:sybindin-like family protein [Eremomyces bilateralis CBS 781.70]KAF1808954.1 sybindin-like family protein [Eremomyces bilateralis CBS 781.70]
MRREWEGEKLPRVVFTLLIVSKAGGLIYNREFHAGLSKQDTNELLIIAGTFHGVHAISQKLCPVPPAQPPPSNIPTMPVRPSGIEVMESANFRLQCFQTVTGTKFLLFTEPQQPNIDGIMRRIYELYCDFAMKNPFYTVEMPIRCEKFDRGLDGFVKATR